MASKNYLKIIIGFIFICVSALSAYYAFNVISLKGEQEKKELKIAQELDIIEAQIKEEKDAIKLKSLVTQAEELYGQSEKSKSEGFLWVDHKSEKYVVTLGALNDVLPGHQLTVYDGKRMVGKVKVDISFDVISYVSPVEESLNLEAIDYYQVVKE